MRHVHALAHSALPHPWWACLRVSLHFTPTTPDLYLAAGSLDGTPGKSAGGAPFLQRLKAADPVLPEDRGAMAFASYASMTGAMGEPNNPGRIVSRIVRAARGQRDAMFFAARRMNLANDLIDIPVLLTAALLGSALLTTRTDSALWLQYVCAGIAFTNVLLLTVQKVVRPGEQGATFQAYGRKWELFAVGIIAGRRWRTVRDEEEQRAAAVLVDKYNSMVEQSPMLPEWALARFEECNDALSSASDDESYRPPRTQALARAETDASIAEVEAEAVPAVQHAPQPEPEPEPPAPRPSAASDGHRPRDSTDQTWVASASMGTAAATGSTTLGLGSGLWQGSVLVDTTMGLTSWPLALDAFRLVSPEHTSARDVKG